MISDMKILYLAHYAPTNLNAPIPTGIRDVVYAEYHCRVYQILSDMFPNVISQCDPAFILQNPLNFDYIFSLYNRMPFNNSEIFVSAVSEYHRIPYLGARPNIRALAEDKHLAKMMAEHAGVPTPKWTVFNIGETPAPPAFAPPYFVKPRFGAASIGIDRRSICPSWEAAIEKIQSLHDAGLDVILEEQICGIYHTNPVLSNFGTPLFLPCISQHSTEPDGIVTYEQKRKIVQGLRREVLRNTELQDQMHTYSRNMFSLIQPIDYTRFDYIVEEKSGIPYFIEFNVCCNLGEHSTVSQAALQLGIDYESLIANITYSSMYRCGLLKDTLGKKF